MAELPHGEAVIGLLTLVAAHSAHPQRSFATQPYVDNEVWEFVGRTHDGMRYYLRRQDVDAASPDQTNAPVWEYFVNADGSSSKDLMYVSCPAHRYLVSTWVEYDVDGNVKASGDDTYQGAKPIVPDSIAESGVNLLCNHPKSQ